jgi:hypothetical protein
MIEAQRIKKRKLNWMKLKQVCKPNQQTMKRGSEGSARNPRKAGAPKTATRKTVSSRNFAHLIESEMQVNPTLRVAHPSWMSTACTVTCHQLAPVTPNSKYQCWHSVPRKQQEVC